MLHDATNDPRRKWDCFQLYTDRKSSLCKQTIFPRELIVEIRRITLYLLPDGGKPALRRCHEMDMKCENPNLLPEKKNATMNCRSNHSLGHGIWETWQLLFDYSSL